MNSRLAYLHLTLANSKSKGQGHAHFDFQCLVSGDRLGKNELMPTNRTSHTPFPSAYLYFTLVSLKGQGHVHFDCQYLAIGDIWQQIESRVWPFD